MVVLDRAHPGDAGLCGQSLAAPDDPGRERADLERHARDFAARSGFTYTVLDPSDRGVIGCVYIYPDKQGGHDAVVQSWVRATHADRDAALRELVSRWLAEVWPFERTAY